VVDLAIGGGLEVDPIAMPEQVAASRSTWWAGPLPLLLLLLEVGSLLFFFWRKFVGRGEGIETREFMNCILQLLSDNKEREDEYSQLVELTLEVCVALCPGV
jgi:hypothetical protein